MKNGDNEKPGSQTQSGSAKLRDRATCWFRPEERASAAYARYSVENGIFPHRVTDGIEMNAVNGVRRWHRRQSCKGSAAPRSQTGQRGVKRDNPLHCLCAIRLSHATAQLDGGN